MEQSKSLSKIEQSALQVSYEVLGTKVELDINFVKNYLVRGRAELVTDQELVMFINTCKMQRLNPLATGEVYLIKYSKDEPAQLVVGKDAYTKRAFLNPSFLAKKDGIVVIRGNDIVKKEGCCIYPTEKLIGGWCRVFYERRGKEREAYREVSLDEYDKKMANWKSKPATMINKVAISQCIRDAFPAEFEGLYSEEELVASGVIEEDSGNLRVDEDGVIITDEDITHIDDGNRIITQDERKALFAKAQELYGKEGGNNKVKELLEKENVESTTALTKAQYDRMLAALVPADTDEDTDEIVSDDSTDADE